MYDEDEDLLADIIDTYAEMQYKCVEEVLKPARNSTLRIIGRTSATTAGRLSHLWFSTGSAGSTTAAAPCSRQYGIDPCRLTVTELWISCFPPGLRAGKYHVPDRGRNLGRPV